MRRVGSSGNKRLGRKEYFLVFCVFYDIRISFFFNKLKLNRKYREGVCGFGLG